MKAQSLWAGHDYAHWPYRSRGNNYTPNIERVRVVRVVKEKQLYKKNETTYAYVQMLDWDGNVTQEEQKVRAYDIVDFWEDYWNEHSEALLKNKAWRDEQEKIRQERHEQMMRERQEREEAMRREREEREAREAAERERIQHKRNKVLTALAEKGIEFNKERISERYSGLDVYLDESANSLTIKGEELERWLGVIHAKTLNL